MRNLYKKIFLNGFLTLCFFNTVMASYIDAYDDKTLLMGCRPWDKNVQNVKGIDAAHCIDFMNHDIPTPPPSTFHHLDFNDEGICSASKFSKFAELNSGRFHTIIIDWATYQHVRRGTAWTDMATLLSKGGTLVVPVTCTNIMTRESLSKQKAQSLIDGPLKNLFNNLQMYSYKEMPTNVCLNLLRRTSQDNNMGITECMLFSNPQIIFAIK